MNKAELVNAVAERSAVTKKKAGEVVDSVFDAIAGVLAKGEKVQLIGFGTFEVKERAARTGRNPQTGEEIKIAAARVPTFKAGSDLKNGVAI